MLLRAVLWLLASVPGVVPMTDPTNDIDALLAFLGRMAMPKQHAALTAMRKGEQDAK